MIGNEIILCGKVSIDTELTNKKHKESIQKVTSFFCSKSDPKYWFTQRINGYTIFFNLEYNKTGDMLLKISSWEEIPNSEKKMEKVKVYDDIKSCYFTRNDKEEKFHWGEKIDYSDISRDHKTHWSRPKNFWGSYKK